MKTFTIRIDSAYTLTVDEIWPDGDAPADPRPADVVAKMKNECGSSYELIREWNLDDSLCVDVNGLPVDL